jgi:hypothetical protein
MKYYIEERTGYNRTFCEKDATEKTNEIKKESDRDSRCFDCGTNEPIEAATHTPPTPWELIGNKIYTIGNDKTRKLIATINSGAFSDCPIGALIVRAVNSHDALLAIAEAMLMFLQMSNKKEDIAFANKIRAVVEKSKC